MSLREAMSKIFETGPVHNFLNRVEVNIVRQDKLRPILSDEISKVKRIRFG